MALARRLASGEWLNEKKLISFHAQLTMVTTIVSKADEGAGAVRRAGAEKGAAAVRRDPKQNWIPFPIPVLKTWCSPVRGCHNNQNQEPGRS